MTLYLNKIYVIFFCYSSASILRIANGFEITGLFQDFGKLFASNAAHNDTQTDDVENETANATSLDDYDENRNGTDLFQENENGTSLYQENESYLKMNDSNEIGSALYGEGDSDSDQRGPFGLLRRFKRQFSSTVASHEQGMFAKMTSLSYQVLQRCFEFWFENIFYATDRNRTKDTATHPFHARSARKIGYFARKVVNATYRRLDEDE